MKISHTFIISALLFLLFTLAACSSDDNREREISELIDQYDLALKNRETVSKGIAQKIDSFRSVPLKSYKDTIDNYLALSEAYSHLSIDSALRYSKQVVRLAGKHRDDSAKIGALIQQAHLYITQGNYNDGSITVLKIKEDSVPGSLRLKYHVLGQLAASAQFDHAIDSTAMNYFRERGMHHVDRVLSIAPETSTLHDLAKAMQFKFNGNEDKLLPFLLSVQMSEDAPSNVKSAVASMLATYYLRREGPNSENAGRYLLLAATSKLQEGRSPSLVAPQLGEWFYNIGEYDRSLGAMRLGFDSAVSQNEAESGIDESAPMRVMYSQAEINKRHFRSTFIVLVVAVIVVLGLITFGIIYLRRQSKLINTMRKRQKDLIDAKEVRIGRFFDIIADLIENYESYNSMVTRMVAQGRGEDLVRQLRMGKFLSDNTKVMSKGFDDVFLGIFPNFIADLNQLLVPEKRYYPTKVTSLTPELRVIALERLDIRDSIKLARLMGLSVNTIYAYRNRVRSRAINRDTFDADLMMIGIAEL